MDPVTNSFSLTFSERLSIGKVNSFVVDSYFRAGDLFQAFPGSPHVVCDLKEIVASIKAWFNADHIYCYSIITYDFDTGKLTASCTPYNGEYPDASKTEVVYEGAWKR